MFFNVLPVVISLRFRSITVQTVSAFYLRCGLRFLNQPESLRQPTAEDYALAALLNGEVINAPAPLFPVGTITREDAKTVSAYYSNVAIENDQSSHFQLAMRDENGQLIERVWNFQPDAGQVLNSYLKTHGKAVQQ